MRFVDRSTEGAPPSLTDTTRAGPKELVRVRRKFTSANPPKTFQFRAYKGDDVRQALERLFHGKCAYCESRYDITGPVDIEHYRPKAGIEGLSGHRGYWWLAGAWDNLLPSCIDCNRRRFQATPTDLASVTAVLDDSQRQGFSPCKTGKETSFPIPDETKRLLAEPAAADRDAAIEAEDALLLDPCRHQPSEHLRFHIDRDRPLGLVLPTGGHGLHLPAIRFGASEDTRQIEVAARAAGLSLRGSVSIQVYGLNRLGLVQERTRLLRRLEVLGDLVLGLFKLSDDLRDLADAEADLGKRTKLSSLADRARAMAHRGLADVREAGKPHAPFSSAARAWTDDFRAEFVTVMRRVPAP